MLLARWFLAPDCTPLVKFMEGDFSECLWSMYSLVIAGGQMSGWVSYVLWLVFFGGGAVWVGFFVNRLNKELENTHREKAYTGPKMLGDKLTYFQVGYFYR